MILMPRCRYFGFPNKDFYCPVNHHLKKSHIGKQKIDDGSQSHMSIQPVFTVCYYDGF